ncbi:hypothetical protein [Chitinophaga sp. CF418]|uniref:hypothetical protein n=1 Tax=Chitinophaga sp. CF418 TaxID=1855287 RepID=UPI0009148F5C|nr:hypothetical protein [Chitinophaga sp. CF418]SHN23328.1 hypothetical protein SAMN05216311_107149 [Chitinophaga sp. CF418]
MSDLNIPIHQNDPNNRNNPFNVELLREMAANQKEEIKCKQQELALRGKEIGMAHELSMRNIDIHAEYMRNTPKYVFRNRLLIFLVIITILLIMILFFIYCLYSGNKEIVMRVIEIIVTALLSGSSGYVMGRTKKEQAATAVTEPV